MSKRIILAGGGTGGHIFPAIAIANAVKKKDSAASILFVGAKGKMEMEKVPQAGYAIKGLDIAGLNRSAWWKNIGLPFKLIKSFFQVRKIFREFKPDAVLGVGGYSSFPVLKYAQQVGIPTYLHEANSYAGKSNQMLGKKAAVVFVATKGMESFFPAEKIVVSGNPVRDRIAMNTISRDEAVRFFGLDPSKPVVLSVGGSLGAKSINEAIGAGLSALQAAGIQLIWQTGKPYAATAHEQAEGRSGVWVNEFIREMEYAYAAADCIVSRAGAMTIAEIAVVKKPAILVPYPFAAEDHQTVNAGYLVTESAALLVTDKDAAAKLVPTLIDLVANVDQRAMFSKNLEKLATTNADELIANYLVK